MESRSYQRRNAYPTSPIKNIFMTLYLLNNTFNENLFYDGGVAQTSRNLRVVPLEDIEDSSYQNKTLSPDSIGTLPLLQIPATWSDKHVRSHHRYFKGKKGIGIRFDSVIGYNLSRDLFR